MAPRHPRGHLQLARALEAAGRTAEAVERYRHALGLHSGRRRAEVHARLAQALADEGEVEKAVVHFGKAVSLRPEFPEAHANLGLVLLRAGRAAEAHAALERAVTQGVDDVEVRTALGEAALRLGREAEAVRCFRDVLARSPSLHAANNLAWLLATSADPAVRSPAEAVRIAERAAEDESAAVHAELLDTLAVAYAVSGRWSDAARTAERAARIATQRGEGEKAARLRERAGGYRRGEMPPGGDVP